MNYVAIPQKGFDMVVFECFVSFLRNGADLGKYGWVSVVFEHFMCYIQNDSFPKSGKGEM